MNVPRSILSEDDRLFMQREKSDDSILDYSRRFPAVSSRRGSTISKAKLPQQSAVSAFPLRVLPKLYFLEQLRREKLRSSRTNSPLSMAIFHIEDEVAIRPSASTAFLMSLQSMVRETDILAYVGKNLIALLLPDTSEEGAQELVRKIVNSHHRFKYSLNVVTYPDQLFEALQTEGQLRPDLVPFLLEESPKLGKADRMLKRGLDVVGALVGILFLLPLMVIMGIAIKLTSPGPIIFKQVRLGARGTPFVFYKFRSMYQDTDEQIHRNYIEKFIDGNHEETNQGTEEKPFYKMSGDPRITWVGRIIRKTSIDELPQLYNVLKGDMSLVGPRPPLPYEVKRYHAWHLRRILEMKPGITGLWQVSGRSETSFDEMVRLDLLYTRRWSIGLDLKLIARTVKTVVQCKGAA